MSNTEESTHLRQMSAVIGKLLSDLEQLPVVQELHPFEFDKIRRRCIKATWDCYAVGRMAGISEIIDGLHPSKSGTVSS